MSTTRLVGAPLRASSKVVMFTFYASDFAGHSVQIVNTSPNPSFYRVGRLREVLGAGEDRVIAIPADADYRIELGVGMRLEQA